MLSNRRFFTRIVLLLVVLASLVLPLTASAGNSSTRTGAMFVPPNATRDYRLQVGQFGVTIPTGAMPKGGLVILRVTTQRDGSFEVDFYPEMQFAKQVIMDFGPKTQIVYYHDDEQLVPIPTSDVDGDGQGGEILSWHFSRYSGW
jgi:hypothetical protein